MIPPQWQHQLQELISRKLLESKAFTGGVTATHRYVQNMREGFLEGLKAQDEVAKQDEPPQQQPQTRREARPQPEHSYERYTKTQSQSSEPKNEWANRERPK